MLPPPTTTATSTPNSATSFTCFATDCMTAGSIPYPRLLFNATPLNFNKTLRYGAVVKGKSNDFTDICMDFINSERTLFSTYRQYLLFHLAHNFFSKIFFTFFHTFADFKTDKLFHRS